MKHLTYSEDRGWDFAGYFRYLESVRASMPDAVYEYFSDMRHYDLASHTSLHDAWLEYANIREDYSGARKEVRRNQIELCLLGPYHDMRVHLNYSNVSAYRFAAASATSVIQNSQVGHGDLIVHELTLVRDGVFCHELLFSTGSSMAIEFSDFSFRYCEI